MIDEALAKQNAAPAPAPAPAAEQLPSLEQMRIWYAIQREKLGENNEEVRNIAMMIKALSPPTFSIDFPGGTVADFLAAIRKAHPGANIVTSGGLDSISIPPVTLTGVSLEGVLRSLALVAQNSHGDSANLDVYFVDGVASVSLPAASLTIFEPEEPSTLVWNSRTLTSSGSVTVSDITGAIDTALSVFTDPKPEVRIHEQTGILVVRGTEDQLNTVREVIDQLGEMPDAAKQANAAIRHEQEIVDKMRQQVRAVELQITNLENRRKTVQAGSESDDIDSELSRLRMMLDEGRARLQAATESLETAKARAPSAAR
jgi:hypothetical protein